jgi:hypothetical protein
MKKRTRLHATLVVSSLFACGFHVAGDEDEQPYDPTSPEQVAEREGPPEDGGSLLAGPQVEPESDQGGRGNGGMQLPKGEKMARNDVVGIFSARCEQCHGANSQKGGIQVLPLDQLFTGSEEYWVVRPGDPEASELFRRITLDHADPDYMPAKGDPLTKAEVTVIEEWITSGAPRDVQPARRQSRVSPRQWSRVYMELDLTESQRSQAVSKMQAYQQTNGEFDRKNRARMRELQEELRETRNSNDTIANAAMKQELERLQGERPQFDTVQAELWLLLDAEQQESMRTQLETLSTRGGAGMQPGERPSQRGQRGRGGRPGNESTLSSEEREQLRELMKRRRGRQGPSDEGGD